MLLQFGVTATILGSIMPSIQHILCLVLFVAVAVSAINFTLLGMILRTSDSREKALLNCLPINSINIIILKCEILIFIKLILLTPTIF